MAYLKLLLRKLIKSSSLYNCRVKQDGRVNCIPSNQILAISRQYNGPFLINELTKVISQT